MGCKDCTKKGKLKHMYHHWELELPPDSDKIREIEVRLCATVKDEGKKGKGKGKDEDVREQQPEKFKLTLKVC